MTLDPSAVADTVADVVRAVPGVADLHPGMFGEVATYLPGRRLAGVRVTDERVDVHITVTQDAPIRSTAAAVRTAVAAVLPELAVDVTVEDVAPNPIATPPSGGLT